MVSQPPPPPPPPATVVCPPSSSTKVCVILTQYDDNDSPPPNPTVLGNICHVYVVDADSDADRKKIEPIVQIKVLGEIGVVVLNSTLYMFVGSLVSRADSRKNRSAYKYKLDLNGCNTGTGTGAVLSEMDLERLPEMAQSKTMPIAAAAPDGERIIVFSAAGHAEPFDFEVYDTKSEKWRKKLPSLDQCFRKVIEGYGFLNDSVFIVTFCDNAPSFYIDINDESESNCWKATRVIVSTYGPFVVIEDEQLYISSFEAGDLNNSVYSRLRMPSFSKDVYETPNFFSLVSHEKKKNCIFWNLASAMYSELGLQYLAVNMYSCDIKEFLAKKEYLAMKKEKGKGKGKEKGKAGEQSCSGVIPSPTLIKSLEYELAANPSSDNLTVIFAGPIVA